MTDSIKNIPGRLNLKQFKFLKYTLRNKDSAVSRLRVKARPGRRPLDRLDYYVAVGFWLYRQISYGDVEFSDLILGLTNIFRFDSEPGQELAELLRKGIITVNEYITVCAQRPIVNGQVEEVRAF